MRTDDDYFRLGDKPLGSRCQPCKQGGSGEENHSICVENALCDFDLVLPFFAGEMSA
jgi:hypothetical protein